jgi:poly(glycerol-phosphate) alpha-glucosyltransferase
VVHGHGFYVYPNWAVGGQARRLDKPLVYHPQGMFEPWILRRSRLKKGMVSILFENQNMNHCRLWRALTNKEADQILNQGFKAPIVVAPNGVRLEELDADPPPGVNGHLRLPERAQNRKRLVFMARLHPKKGLDLLLPAWAKLVALHKGWELLIAGPDEAGYRASVEKMIRDLDLASSVTLLGAVTGSSKLELLRGADLFTLPSYSEGVPVAVLEAMACRVAVVATRESNIPDLEREGGGWLCEANPESVRTTLNRAISCFDSERKARGSSARVLVEQRYTWARITSIIREATQHHCT